MTNPEILVPPQSFFDESDRPLMASGDDQLNRKGFAEAIAESIRRWRSQESLVLGISGSWGVGKTSLANFVTEMLTQDSSEYRVIDFNPWVFGSRASLVESFFEEIGIALGSASKDKQRETAKAWRRYGDRLQHGVKLAKHFHVGMQAAALAAVYCFGVGLRSLSRWGWILGVILLVLASAVGWLTKLVGLVGEYLTGDANNEPAVHVLKDQLKGKLLEGKERLVIVIDDLDRIYPKQLTQMVQLIASNVDLPNVAYLLVGDREVIANGLSSELKINGQAYLEKILHVSLLVPSDSGGEAFKILARRLDHLFLTDQDGAEAFDFRRWPEIYRLCLSPNLRHLRAVKRFLNILTLHKAVLSTSGTLEVDPVDLIAIESLGVFQPDFFLRIRAHKEFLTARSNFERPQKDAAERLLTAIIGPTDEVETARRRAILRELFPVIERYQSLGQANSYSDTWADTSRVATAEHFERYFSLNLAPGDISNTHLNVFFRAANVAQVEAILERWYEDNALEKGLQRLWQRVDSVTASAYRSVCIGVLNFGDRLTSDSEGMFQLGSMRTGEGIIFSILKAEARTGNPAALLRDVLGASTGVSLPAHIVALVTNLTQTPELEQYFSEDQVKSQLRMWLIQRIEEYSTRDSFLDLGDLKFVLRLWIEWGDKDSERARIVELCQKPLNAAKFVRAMLQISHTSNLDKFGRSRRVRISPTDLEQYGSWKQIRHVLLESSLPETSEGSFAEAFDALQKAATREDAGKSESNSPFDDDD